MPEKKTPDYSFGKNGYWAQKPPKTPPAQGPKQGQTQSDQGTPSQSGSPTSAGSKELRG